MKIALLVGGAVIALAGSSALAQDIVVSEKVVENTPTKTVTERVEVVRTDAGDYGFAKGDNEFLLNGAGIASDDWKSTNFSLGAQYGWFLTDQIVAGARAGLAWADVEGGDSTTQFSFAGYADYHFDLEKWQPFVGATFGWIGGDDVADSLFVGAEGGVKYFLNTTTFLYGQMTYQYFFEEEDGDNLFDQGRWVYAVGMGLRF